MANQDYQEFARACQEEIGDENTLKAVFVAVGSSVAKQQGQQVGSEEQAMQLGAQALQAAWQKQGKQKGFLRKLVQQMTKAQKAEQGAKLNYIQQLQGRCPEGYEVEKFLAGGCVKCRKKAAAALQIKPRFEKDGGKTAKNCGGARIKFGKGDAIQHVKGGPASINSTDDMKLNKKQRRMLPKHEKGGTSEHNKVVRYKGTFNSGDPFEQYTASGTNATAGWGRNGFWYSEDGNPETGVFGKEAEPFFHYLKTRFSAPMEYVPIVMTAPTARPMMQASPMQAYGLVSGLRY